MKGQSRPPDNRVEAGQDDMDAFRRAMSEVRPLKPGPSKVRPPKPVPRPRESDAGPSPMDEFMASADVDLTLGADYIEGGSESRKVMAKLRRGGFARQSELDLHGLTREEARRALEGYLEDCVRRGLGCVRIIHGTGMHSPQGRAVLKEHLREWFRSRRFSRWIGAYCTATRHDGGLGAVYVLLRGWRRPR